LSAEDLAEINDMLAEQAGRRRRSSPNAAIRIMVDGVERGRLNPAEQSSISFSAEEDAEIIEVKTTGPDGELLLATHLLTSFEKDAHDATIVSSIRLEGGQHLSLSITRRQIEANGGADLLIKFGYRETEPRRAARLWWQRLKLRLSPERGTRILWGSARISARHILVGSVVVLCLTGFLAYLLLRPRPTSGPSQTSVVQTTPSNQEPSVPSSSPAEAPAKATVPDLTASKPERRPRSERSAATRVPAVVNSSPGAGAPAQAGDEDVTRSSDVVPNLKLSEVKKIYIEIRGNAAFNELRSNLVDSLRSSGVVAVASNADDADAALKIVVSQTGPQIEASVLLVNARGTVLWPKAGRGARHYSGEIPKVASDIAKDLASEIKH
jgi:hypothetical protein